MIDGSLTMIGSLIITYLICTDSTLAMIGLSTMIYFITGTYL